ncbi:MAG: hypothetical protein RL235_378 [Chlamydiota bacterium]|jgi:aspartate carbamoyltransferase regulatory subunit
MERTVAAIRKGTVIDHIDKGQGLRLALHLKLAERGCPVTVGLNLESASMGRKDLIKFEGGPLTPKELTIISLFAPRATISTIDAYKVIDKVSVSMPKQVVGTLVCYNRSCVTRAEPIETHFFVGLERGMVVLQCRHCESSFARDVVYG